MNTQQTDALQEMTADSMTPYMACQQLIKLKQLREEIEARENELKAKLLEVMKRNDVLSLKTGEYTVSRSTRITPVITDFTRAKSALSQITEVRTVETFDDSMKPVIRQLLANGFEIEGIQAQVTEYANIRLAKGK